MGTGQDKLMQLHALRVKLQNRLVLEAGERDRATELKAAAAEVAAEFPMLSATYVRRSVAHKAVADGLSLEIARIGADIERLNRDEAIPAPRTWAREAAGMDLAMEAAL